MRFRILALLIALLLFACKSAETRKMESEYKLLIEELANLYKNGSEEQARYDRIANRLKEILANPAIVEERANATLASELLQKVQAANCTAATADASKTSDAALQFTLVLACDHAVQTALATLERDGVQFQSGQKNVTVDLKQSANKELRGAFTLRRSAPEINSVAVNAAYRGAAAYALLKEKFSLPNDFSIRLNNSFVALAPTEGGVRNSYSNFADAGQSSAGEAKHETGDYAAEAEISESGQFTMGASYKGQNFDLMYGHPNGVYAEGIGTSFVTVRIDGQDYRLGRDSAPENERTADKIVSTYSFLDGAITIRQILKPLSEATSAKVSVTYEIANGDRKSHSIGIRLMLDTWAGSNDGVPFLLPIGRAKQLFTEEVEFTPTASPMWQTFDPDSIKNNPDADHVYLYNQMAGEGLTPPNRIAFANWGLASASTWDYTVIEGSRITGDSAVIMWWNPKRVAPQKKISIGTMLGIIIQKREPSVFVTDAAEGYVSAYLFHQNESNAEQRLRYNVRCMACTFNGEAPVVTARVPPGETYINSLLLQVQASDDAKIRIRETVGTTAHNFDFPIELKPVWGRARTSPIAAPREPIQVRYFSKEAMRLRARLINPDGKILKTIRLKRAAWGGGYNYQGTFIAPEGGDGAYAVEVFE